MEEYSIKNEKKSVVSDIIEQERKKIKGAGSIVLGNRRGIYRGDFWSPVETGVNEIFQFREDQKKGTRDRKEAFHWKSTPEAHDSLGLEMTDLRLTIAAYERKRNFATDVAEESLARRTCS